MEYFSLLPEGCVSEILSLTSPGDACRSSAVCSGFKTAADSDIVWGKFLPSDYREIIARSASPLDLATMTKKQIYFSLSSPILLDGGKLSFEIDIENGKKCYTMPARELYICWSGTPQYWSWISIPESRFSEVAELRAVCWFDIMGKLNCKMLSPKTTYTAYLIFQLSERGSNLDSSPMKAFVEVTPESESLMVRLDAIPQTFENSPSKHSIREDVNDGIFNRHCLDNVTTVYLQMETFRPVPSISGGRLPQMTRSGWMEIELGEFFSSHLGEDNEEDGGIVKMRLMGFERGNWKRGLIVEGIQVRPKHA